MKKRVGRLSLREKRLVEASGLPPHTAHLSLEDRADGPYLIFTITGQEEQAFGPFESKEQAKEMITEIGKKLGLSFLGPGADEFFRVE